MTKISLLSIVSAAFALSFSLTAQPASALPCCSACFPGNPVCVHGCSTGCKEDVPAAPGNGVYDEAAGLCYVAVDE